MNVQLSQPREGAQGPRVLAREPQVRQRGQRGQARRLGRVEVGVPRAPGVPLAALGRAGHDRGMPDAAARAATLEDFLSMPEERRFHELLGGAIVEKATPSGEHGDAQAGVVGAVRPPYQRPPGRGGPGGWWIATEVEVLLPAGEVVRPDVVVGAESARRSGPRGRRSASRRTGCARSSRPPTRTSTP